MKSHLISLDQNTHRLSLQSRHNAHEGRAPRLTDEETVQHGVLVVRPVHRAQELYLMLRREEHGEHAGEVGGEVPAMRVSFLL